MIKIKDLRQTELFDRFSELLGSAGKCPIKSRYNHETQKGYAIFFKTTCNACPFNANCPVQKYGKHNYKWEYDAVKLRLRERRLYEHTPEFHTRYAPRNGIEGLNCRR